MLVQVYCYNIQVLQALLGVQVDLGGQTLPVEVLNTNDAYSFAGIFLLLTCAPGGPAGPLVPSGPCDPYTFQKHIIINAYK